MQIKGCAFLRDRMNRSVVIKKMFYDRRKELGRGVFINENLTKTRDNLLFHCRQMKKEKKILAAWSNDGQVKIKLNDESNKPVKDLKELHDLIGQ